MMTERTPDDRNDHDNALRLGSKLIHAGQRPDPVTGAVMPPVSLSSTYAQPSPGKHLGYEYSRSHNPTRYALERCLARVEGSTLTEAEDVSFGGFAFASGLASIGTALELLDSGAELIAMDDMYGGTYRLMTNVRERSMNLQVKYVDLTGIEALKQSITERTRMIWIESPTNPTLKLADLAEIAALGGDRDILTVCDNTFATPMLQRPLELGFDMVMHSVTKYLGGHSDVVGGALVTNRADLAQRIRYLQNAIGSIMSPFDAYLALRGMKTLAVRMRQHCANAAELAAWLSEQPAVERVVYPGLASHPQYELAQRQMLLDGEPAGGGIITIYLAGGLDESRRFLENLHVFTLAESLGGIESLVDHPAIMTHASVPPDMRAELGISDSLVRLSVGIEDVEDLRDDLAGALQAMHTSTPALSSAR